MGYRDIFRSAFDLSNISAGVAIKVSIFLKQDVFIKCLYGKIELFEALQFHSSFNISLLLVCYLYRCCKKTSEIFEQKK